MTTILKWFCVFSIVACGIHLPDQGASQQEHMVQRNANPVSEQEMMESMGKMDRDMLAALMTGDPNHDFSAMMIPHHQGAIDMAKAFLLHGKDPVLRRLAQEIIVTQQQEIEVMRFRLVALQTGAASPPQQTQLDATASILVSGKDRGLHRRPDLEHHFGDRCYLEQITGRQPRGDGNNKNGGE